MNIFGIETILHCEYDADKIIRLEDIGWKLAQEPDAVISELSSASTPVADNVQMPAEHTANNSGRQIIEQQLCQKNYVTHFKGDAGATIQDEDADKYGFSVYANRDNIFNPFTSTIDWRVAQWAKMCGPGSKAVTELLEIP